MSTILNKAASVPLPKAAADSTGKTGTQCYASSASNQSFTIPTAWRGSWITIQSCGCYTDVGHGVGSAPTMVLNQAAAVGTGHVSAGPRIHQDSDADYLVPENATHLAFISSGTGGFVKFWLSEARRVGKSA